MANKSDCRKCPSILPYFRFIFNLFFIYFYYLYLSHACLNQCNVDWLTALMYLKRTFCNFFIIVCLFRLGLISKIFWAERMVLWETGSEDSGNIWGSTSAFLFLDPVWFVKWKLNLKKNKAHLVYRGLRHLVDLKYFKFLWSVKILIGWQAPSSRYLHSYKATLIARSSQSPRS